MNPIRNSHRAGSNPGDQKGYHSEQTTCWPQTKEVSISAQTSQGASHPKEKSTVPKEEKLDIQLRSCAPPTQLLLKLTSFPQSTHTGTINKKATRVHLRASGILTQLPFPVVVTYCYTKEVGPEES